MRRIIAVRTPAYNSGRRGRGRASSSVMAMSSSSRPTATTSPAPRITCRSGLYDGGWAASAQGDCRHTSSSRKQSDHWRREQPPQCVWRGVVHLAFTEYRWSLRSWSGVDDCGRRNHLACGLGLCRRLRDRWRDQRPVRRCHGRFHLQAAVWRWRPASTPQWAKNGATAVTSECP